MPIICDVEYTTWDNALDKNWGEPGQHREIIQIGAVEFDWDVPWQEAQHFDTFVKPVLNPMLSNFCKELTGITQKQVNTAPSTEAALNALQNFCGNQPVYSNGNDINPIAETCGLQGVMNPLRVSNWASLRAPLYAALHAEVGNFKDEDYPSGKVYTLLNIDLGMDDATHNGLFDCFSLAATLQELDKRGRRVELPAVPQFAT